MLPEPRGWGHWEGPGTTELHLVGAGVVRMQGPCPCAEKGEKELDLSLLALQVYAGASC